VHWWDNPSLEKLLARQLPPSRMVFWCHKRYNVPDKYLTYPDRFLGVSPIQGHGDSIWSTRGMADFLKIERDNTKGFNVGYAGTVDYKKMHANIIDLSEQVNVPDVHFYFCGKNNIDTPQSSRFIFTGESDMLQYYPKFDVLGYALRPDHYGTCEQVLGEAMAAGIVPVVMDNEAEGMIVEDGVTGFISYTEDEYVENIEHLYHKPQLRAWMSTNARRAASQIYNLDMMVIQWNNLFENMMKEPKKERRPV
jgi:glycosyltransferase involved in cell wall biosynthesis